MQSSASRRCGETDDSSRGVQAPSLLRTTAHRGTSILQDSGQSRGRAACAQFRLADGSAVLSRTVPALFYFVSFYFTGCFDSTLLLFLPLKQSRMDGLMQSLHTDFFFSP